MLFKGGFRGTSITRPSGEGEAMIKGGGKEGSKEGYLPLCRWVGKVDTVRVGIHMSSEGWICF